MLSATLSIEAVNTLYRVSTHMIIKIEFHYVNGESHDAYGR